MALNSNSFLRFVDVWGEGEIEGLATPVKNGRTNAGQIAGEQLKDVFLENTPVLRPQATVFAGTYSQTNSKGALTGTYSADADDITITISQHKLIEGDKIKLTFTSGLAESDTYTVDSVTSSSIFVVPNISGEVTSGNVEMIAPADEISVTTTASHGLSNGDKVYLAIGTGNAVSGDVKVRDVTATAFNADATSEEITSGEVGMMLLSDLNFKSTEITTRLGTTDQATVLGFDQIESETPVGVVIEKDAPITRTLTNPNIDAVRITVGVQALQKFTDDGSIVGSQFKFQIELAEAGASPEVIITDTVKGKATSTYLRDYEINLLGRTFPIDIRLTRITKDSTTAKNVNAFQWVSYVSIVDARLRYPHTAYAATRISAEEFSSIPTRAYRIRGRKVSVPNNATVDLATGALIYTGTWSGTFAATKVWTSDPAWCLWDLLTDYRAGFGNHIDVAQLDKFSFYSASVYSSALNTYTTDGRSGTTDDYAAVTGKHGVPTGKLDDSGNMTYEPRFSCNINLQTQTEAYKVIGDLCSIFRAMPYWAAGSLTISQDSPQDPVYLFTLANVTEEGFAYSGASQKTQPSVVLVKYIDLDTRDEAYEQVEDADAINRIGIITEEVEAVGCTSQSQARRVGEWFLYTNTNEGETVSFTSSMDAGAVVRPGDVIAISDPVKAGGRYAGRIAAATTTTITVDDYDGLPASGGDLSVVMPDGTVEKKAVSSRTTNVITLSTALSTTPNTNSVWLWETTSVSATTWRVISIAEKDGTNYEVSALSYNAGKYDYVEREQDLQPKDVTLLDEAPATPANLAFTEDLYTYQNQVLSKIILSWNSVETANSYEVRYAKDDDNFTVGTTQGTAFDILNVTPGEYEVEVYALTGGLIPSNEPATLTINALGKTAPPANVTGFTATVDPDIGVTLTWTANTELDLQGYEIWQSAIWGSGTKIGVFFTTQAKIGQVPAGTTTWTIKALDTSGVYSVNSASVSATISGSNAPDELDATIVGSDLKLDWYAVNGTLATSTYQIRYGTTANDAEDFEDLPILGTVQGTSFLTPVTWDATRRFFVAAVDIKGNIGFASFVDSTITNPTEPSITPTVVDNIVKLSWNDCTQTLPLDSYQIRRGATFGSATIIGTKKGEFTTIVETTAASNTYHVVGIDSAGNQGTPGSVTVQVSAPPDYTTFFDGDSSFTGTFTNAVLSDGAVYAMIDTTQTWQTHFTGNSYSTLQDQVTAGFDLYALPSETSGSYEEEFDIGSVVSGVATFLLEYETLSGSVTVTPTLSVKEASGDPWTDYSGVSTKYANNYRYVKINYAFSGSGNNDSIKITHLNLKVDSKLKSEGGSGTAVSTDSGGTTVNITGTFVNIDSVTITPSGTSAVLATVDAITTSSFKVLLFNTSGTRVSGDFNYVVQGS